VRAGRRFVVLDEVTPLLGQSVASPKQRASPPWRCQACYGAALPGARGQKNQGRWHQQPLPPRSLNPATAMAGGLLRMTQSAFSLRGGGCSAGNSRHDFSGK
jgi:hypothetical protein